MFPPPPSFTIIPPRNLTNESHRLMKSRGKTFASGIRDAQRTCDGKRHVNERLMFREIVPRLFNYVENYSWKREM